MSHAPASRGRLCCRRGLTAPTIPTAGQALWRRQPHTTAEPVNPHSPLRAGSHCHVVPFLGLAVVHRRGALRAVWSTWSRNDFHWKSTVCGEADSWVHSGSKEVSPYYGKTINSPPDSRDPPEGPLYFAKKVPLADSSDPPTVSSHARKCLLITYKK